MVALGYKLQEYFVNTSGKKPFQQNRETEGSFSDNVVLLLMSIFIQDQRNNSALMTYHCCYTIQSPILPCCQNDNFYLPLNLDPAPAGASSLEFKEIDIEQMNRREIIERNYRNYIWLRDPEVATGHSQVDMWRKYHNYSLCFKSSRDIHCPGIICRDRLSFGMTH